MNKQNIEQLIRDLFRQNFNAYPESYPLTDDGLMSEEGTTEAQEVAKGYWAVRTEDEIERDEKVGVTEIDYVEWVMAELSELIPLQSSFIQSNQAGHPATELQTHLKIKSCEKYNYWKI